MKRKDRKRQRVTSLYRNTPKSSRFEVVQEIREVDGKRKRGKVTWRFSLDSREVSNG